MTASPPTDHLLELRNLVPTDYPALREVMARAYPPEVAPWTQEQFEAQLAAFPEGQICIEDRGRIAAVALSLVVEYARHGDGHTYWSILGDAKFRNHDPEGDTLYGAEMAVDPDYRSLRLGRRLHDARKELCEKLNLKAIIIGGRIPGYVDHADRLDPREYVAMVRRREIYDPVLTFQLGNDFHVRNVAKGYLPSDAESRSYAVVMEWNNIYYEERRRLIGGRKSHVRLGVVQWQMRPFQSFEDLMQQVEFFVDTVASYQGDLVLFPEFFNAPLMYQCPDADPAEAIRWLSGFSERLRASLLEMSVAYHINIVSGSMPEYRDQKLYNVCYLCRRDGTWDRQPKLHITPNETQYWGLQGGHSLKVFDTDVGKVGILICYDVEFPELARHLVDQGMQILLVPFWTDTKNAYLRVRRCAQARAIENECYVAISGSVGNIPKIENMDIQYAQSAVFTPSDFAFPHDAVAAEATTNTEMTLIADLDLDLLKELRRQGSVRCLQGRRKDLYRVDWLGGKAESATS